jgi:hypothetical protein
MKVTFPHLGTMHIFCKAIAEAAQIPYIVPPETSRRTLTLGVLHSYEYGLWMEPLRTKSRRFERYVPCPLWRIPACPVPC